MQRRSAEVMVGSADDSRSLMARGDRNIIPLGAVWATEEDPASAGTTTEPIQPSQQTAASTTGSPDLPECPAGQPIMVLFPATLHMAVFLAQPAPALLASGFLVLLALLSTVLGAWVRVSEAGVGAAIAAGMSVGLGVRLRPVGRWVWLAFMVFGVALLGGGESSLALVLALAISTLWKHGWWLYLQPEVAPLVLFVCGSTMDVALGFLVSSLIQVHCTKPSQPSSPRPTTPPVPGDGQACATDSSSDIRESPAWTAVTPPGLVTRAGRL